MNNRFCECCGRSMKHIEHMLNKQKASAWGTAMRERKCWKGHYKFTALERRYPIQATNQTCSYCVFCGEKLENDDILIEHNTVPYGSTTATEEIMAGYRCHECGEQVDF